MEDFGIGDAAASRVVVKESDVIESVLLSWVLPECLSGHEECYGLLVEVRAATDIGYRSHGTRSLGQAGSGRLACRWSR
jgi:hypothetical protein